MFLHYVFDMWMKRNFPQAPFERYADDGVVHCRTKAEAIYIKGSLAKRFEECKLELHPSKTRIVYCKDKDRTEKEDFNPSAMKYTLQCVERRLIKWAMCKYKNFRGHRRRAEKRLSTVRKREPKLFAHWSKMYSYC